MSTFYDLMIKISNEQTKIDTSNTALTYKKLMSRENIRIALLDTMIDVKKQFFKQKYKKILEQEYQNGLHFPELKKWEDNLLKKNYYNMVTLNFDDKKICDHLKEIPSIINDKINKKWIMNYIYCVEQRSEIDTEFKGFHVHVIVESAKSKRKSEIIREFYSSYKLYLGDKQKIDVRQFDSKILPNKLNYIQGIKKDEKMKKCDIDIIFRNIYKIEKLYSNNLKYFLD